MASARTASISHARGSIAEIDGLRGIAITLVMLHRLWPRDAHGGAPGIVEAGWIGVDLFFVVSGFLITRILLATRDDPDYFRNFYARRVLRIFPLYYVFVGTLLVVFPILGSAAYLAHAGSRAWYVLFLGNIPEGVLRRDPPYWLAPVWSLAIEEQFYLTFPWLVRWCDRRRLARVLLALVVVAPIARAVALAAWPSNDRLQYLLTPCRVDAIAAGCGVALALEAGWLARMRRGLGVMAVAALAVGCATGLDRTTAWGRVGGYSVVALGFAALLALVLQARDSRATAVLRAPWLRYLGKLCFGLYLLHRPADTVTCALAARLGLDATVGIWWVPVKIAVALAFATVSWRVLESRALRCKRYFASKAHPLARGSGSLAAAGAAAIVVLTACAPHGGGVSAGSDGPGPRADARRASDARGRGDANDVDGATDAGVSAAVVLYPEGLTHSPITPALAAGLQAIAARAPGQHADVFAKIGDSITALPAFMTCFADGPDSLGAYPELAGTLAYYDNSDAAGTSSYARASEAATGGWTAADLLAGSPCPVDSELAAIAPSVAVLMIGTNDNREGRTPAAYGADLWAIVDKLIAAGVVPLVSTIPPIESDPYSNPRVPLFDLIVRAVAQGRQLPLVDFYREMVPLPNQGLGSDGIHPSVAPDGTCMLTSGDLASYGFNVRNLLALEQLDRARAALAGNAPDASAAMREGTGHANAPFVASLPLADLADTRAGDTAFAGYPSACVPAAGHQRVYAVTLAEPEVIDAYVITKGSTTMTLDVLPGELTPSACIAGGQGEVTASLPAGTTYLVVAGATPADDGEYLLAVQNE